MKVVYHYNTGSAFREHLAALEKDEIFVSPCGEEDEVLFANLCSEMEVLWHCLKPVTAAVMEASPNLRLVQKIGVGVNTIDLEAARTQGIHVCNMPGTNSRAVAEMTLNLMLSTLRCLTVFDTGMRQGEGWQWSHDMQDRLGEIAGRTIGLIGYGAVPRILAPILQAMEARVLYTATAPKSDAAAEYRPLAALLAESDIVSLHIPLLPETERLLNAESFAQMKTGAIFINTARGGLVDETALLKALTSGKLLGAGLDVFATEPVESFNPLLSLSNVVLSPHIAWLTMETLRRSVSVAVDNCLRLRRGAALLHQII